MLTLGEMHMQGLSRGFGPGADHSLYGRDSFGFDCVTGSLEALDSTNVGLQQQLNDFIHNSYLQQGAGQQCASLYTDTSSCLLGTSSFSSMGFAQTDIETTFMFGADDLVPVLDHESHLANVTATASNVPSVPFPPIPGLGLPGIPGPLPSSMSMQPLAGSREPWVDDTGTATTSPCGLKRAGSDDQRNMQPARKKSERTARAVDAKCKRPSEQADHIQRERQRRDDMTSKFAVLESLLPISVKRDRSTIVDDSIKHVKNLHHRIKSLQQRKEELKEAAAAAATSNENAANRCWKGHVEVLQQQPTHGNPSELKENPPAAQRSPLSPEERSRIHAVLRSCLEKMEVHADLPHQMVIEMVCRPQPHLQSNILLCLESLNLDVLQCSITKIAHRLICVITAKPQESTSPTSSIVAALKYALGSES